MDLDDQDSYLEVQINDQNSALLPMISIQEVLQVSAANIVPVPNLSSQVLGIFNHRSQVYLVMDLGQILGLAALDVNLSKYAIVILNVKQDLKQNLKAMVSAIAVPLIKGVHKSDQIQPISADSPQIYFKGYLANLPVLSPSALVQTSIQP